VTWFYQKRYPVQGKRELKFCGCLGDPDGEISKCSCITKLDTTIEDDEIEEFVSKLRE